MRSGYVLKGSVPSLKDYSEEGYFTTEQELWQRTVQRVSGMNVLGSALNLRNSSVLIGVRREEKTNLWVAKCFFCSWWKCKESKKGICIFSIHGVQSTK